MTTTEIQKYDRMGSVFFDKDRFEHAQRVAKMITSSTMVPEHFRGDNNIGNCLIALNLAERFNADPIMVMQNIYMVHGKPGIEAKLVISLINNSGKFSPLQFDLKGEKGSMQRSCVCHAIRKGSDQELFQEVSMEMAKKEGWIDKTGSKWKTMPDLMLQYRSATFFARIHCPEVLLGMQTSEELHDVIDLVRTEKGEYEPITNIPDKKPMQTPSEMSAQVEAWQKKEEKAKNDKKKRTKKKTADKKAIPTIELVELIRELSPETVVEVCAPFNVDPLVMSDEEIMELPDADAQNIFNALKAINEVENGNKK